MNQACDDRTPVLDMRGICKRFSGVKVLDGVRLRLFAGEVHALMGENGAGKSTLMKILTGVYSADSGEIRIAGVPVMPASPSEAAAHGVTIIHQDLNQVLGMSVAENFFLGRELTNRLGLLDQGEMRRRTSHWLEELGIRVDPRAPLSNLSVAQRQMVEIAKAVSVSTRVLVMDEPTTALSAEEVEQLFTVVRKLRGNGVAVVYISHRMEEVFALCDRVTVLRDGAYVTSALIADMTRDMLISRMVGRELTQLFPPKTKTYQGEELLRLEDVGVLPSKCRSRVRGVSFSVRAGEVVGLGGLMGAGRTELLEALYGVPDPSRVSGRIHVQGQPVRLRSPRDAIRAGIGFVTEDRKGQSLSLIRPIQENASLVSLSRFSRAGWLNVRKERKAVADQFKQLRVKAPGLATPAGLLSGGNQQKVVLAKFLLVAPRIYLLDEPTQGIDVGAKAEIYTLINELAAQGAAVLMASSDMQELLAMCDRIVVLCEGRMSGELSRAEATQERILDLATRHAPELPAVAAQAA